MTPDQAARQRIIPHLVALAAVDFQIKLHGTVENRLAMIDRRTKLEVDMKKLLRKEVAK